MIKKKKIPYRFTPFEHYRQEYELAVKNITVNRQSSVRRYSENFNISIQAQRLMRRHRYWYLNHFEFRQVHGVWLPRPWFRPLPQVFPVTAHSAARKLFVRKHVAATHSSRRNSVPGWTLETAWILENPLCYFWTKTFLVHSTPCFTGHGNVPCHERCPKISEMFSNVVVHAISRKSV